MIAGSIGHAAAEESSMLSATWPHCVDLSRLPADGRLKNVDYAVVDGDTFDGKPTKDHTLREDQDPRTHTDANWGKELIEKAVAETIEEIEATLLYINGPSPTS